MTGLSPEVRAGVRRLARTRLRESLKGSGVREDQIEDLMADLDMITEDHVSRLSPKSIMDSEIDHRGTN